MKLSETEQIHIINKHAVYLTKLDLKNTSYLLYACGNFYVEITDLHCKHAYVYISVFKDISLLEPYLDHIDVVI